MLMNCMYYSTCMNYIFFSELHFVCVPRVLRSVADDKAEDKERRKRKGGAWHTRASKAKLT